MPHALISPHTKKRDVPSFCQPLALVHTRDVQFTYLIGKANMYLICKKQLMARRFDPSRVFLKGFEKDSARVELSGQ